MRFVIVTGMSGAGKSSVLKMLEDAGYFCVDNLPIPLIPTFAGLTVKGSQNISKIALGIDIRSGQSLEEAGAVLDQLRAEGYTYEILFLECSTSVLVKRYKETRRTHPLSGTDRVDRGIEEERKRLAFLKSRADYILDTSQLLVRELKTQIDHVFVENGSYHNFFITILSFGFKHGIPTDSDLVFDVRFLKNPYYVPELKKLTGRDARVRNYVLESPMAPDFLDKLEEMLLFLIPGYIAEGKNQLVVSIGCTGGHHRSVTVAYELEKRLSKSEYGVKVEHRDIER
ncbi:MAG: RNase adapter RapZ [Lachnospiraceae bacterium]|nr:RNase adapter RapZ [Lachnospiraceae bacterium]